MTWPEFLAAVIGSIIASGVILPTAIWILQLWLSSRIDHEFNKRLEEHKLGLDKQLENHKALLANITGRRVEVVVKTHRLLVRAAREISQYTNPIQFTSDDAEEAHRLRKEHGERVVKYVNMFNSYVYENRPLYDEPLYENLKKLADLLVKTWTRAIIEEQSRRPELKETASDLLDKELSPLLDKITSHARELLRQP